MRQYTQLVQHIMRHGVDKEDRTGTGTRSVFGSQMRFNLKTGFPLLATKRTPFKLVATELLWFLKGNPNISYLHRHNNHIWDEWRRPYSTRRPIVFVERRVKSPVAYSGDFNYGRLGIEQGSIDADLIRTWIGMMKRCYDPANENYRHYGGRGVTVAKEWHDPKVFLEQVKRLPHWWYKQKDPVNFELDKDYYGSNQYGPDTCVWLRKDENKLYMRSAKPIVATTDEGIEHLFVSLNDAAREFGMSNSTLSRFVADGVPTVLKRDNKRFLGWEFKEREVDGKLPRLELIPKDTFGPIYGQQWCSWPKRDGGTIDQISNVVNRLKTDPDNRRLIVSAWNVEDVESGEMALPPCHAFFQFYTRPLTIQGECGTPRRGLSCQLYQRSADVFLGVPFNIASYALLIHMIAHLTNMVPDEFVWTGGDVHLYHNHFDQVAEFLDRDYTKLKKPTLSIVESDYRDIYDFTIDSFVLDGYEPLPAIKAPVAV